MDCIICGQPCRDDPIELRGGLRVCARCIARKEAGLREIESQISRLKSDKPSKNMWDILRYLVILFSVVFGVYALFLIPIPFAIYAGLLIGLLGIILANYASVRSDKWNEPHNLLVRKIQGTLMKIITLHSSVIVVEGFYASASEIRCTWDTSPCDGPGN